MKKRGGGFGRPPLFGGSFIISLLIYFGKLEWETEVALKNSCENISILSELF